MIWTLYNISLPPPQASKDEIILNQPKWTLLRKQNQSLNSLDMNGILKPYTALKKYIYFYKIIQSILNII